MKKEIIFFTLILFLLTTNVYAIGITPSRIDLNFESDYRNTFTFYAINNRDIPVTIEPYIEGELGKYFELLNPESVVIEPRESAEFKFSVRLPSSINIPGEHFIGIGAAEKPPEVPNSASVINAYTRAEMRFKIIVPYPGKYASADLIIEDVNVNQTANFKININNLGDRTINHATGTITIQEGNEIVKIITYENSVSIASKNSATLPFKFETKDMKGGEYQVIAVVDYDDLKATDEELWRLGSIYVELTNYTSEFEKDKINRWDIYVRNKWNKAMEHVYAEAKIMQNDQEIDINARTPTTLLEPWTESRLVAYWDTSGFAVGEYDAKIILHYESESSENLIKIKIVKQPTKLSLQIPLIIEKIGLQLLILIIVILVILIDVLWMLFILKKRKKDDKVQNKKDN